VQDYEMNFESVVGPEDPADEPVRATVDADAAEDAAPNQPQVDTPVMDVPAPEAEVEVEVEVAAVNVVSETPAAQASPTGAVSEATDEAEADVVSAVVEEAQPAADADAIATIVEPSHSADVNVAIEPEVGLEPEPVAEAVGVAEAVATDEEFVIQVPKRKKAAPKGDKADKPKAPRKTARKAEKLPDPGDGSGYEAPQTAEGGDATEDAHWYAVHCYSGYENKVKHNLEQRIETMGMAGKILEVVVPTEDEIEVRDGKRRTVERRVFPGYVMVHMKMSEESWHVVRNTPGVTRFIGMGNRPQPLSPQEVNQILRRMEAEAPKMKVNFRVGQKVRITDGPFSDFMGLVDKIDVERAKVSVLVSFFGRETPVELDFLQVEKM
jgi:transcriptional antiterminator NusG